MRGWCTSPPTTCSAAISAEAAPRPYEPGDETRPLSVYGQSKLAGEQAVLAALPQAVVVRTAWVYTGGNGKDFVAAMRRLAAGDGTVEMVDDQTGSPTYVADLVAALLEVVDGQVQCRRHRARRERGRGHPVRASPRGVRGRRRRPGAGVPVSSDHNPRPAPRPPYSALSGRQSEQAGLSPLRPWRDALAGAAAAAAAQAATLNA